MLWRTSMCLTQALCKQNPALLQPPTLQIHPALLKTLPPQKKFKSKQWWKCSGCKYKQLRRQHNKRHAPTATQQGQELDKVTEQGAQITEAIKKMQDSQNRQMEMTTIYGGYDRWWRTIPITTRSFFYKPSSLALCDITFFMHMNLVWCFVTVFVIFNTKNELQFLIF